MGFQEAVKSFFSRYTDFQGRSSRSEYWWAQLALAIVNYGVILVLAMVLGETIGGILSLIFALVVIIPAIAISVRRFHDIDKSGWWLLIILIPILGLIGLIFFFVQKGTTGPNRFGPDPLGSDSAVFN